MKTLSKIMMLALLMMSALGMSAAENATKILDKTAAEYKKSGDVKIGFTITVSEQSTTGIIQLSGQKFCCTTGGGIAWFDGKTMWHYVKANEEVNVTNPTEKELSKMNPYAFLNLYKSGYTAKLTKTTAKSYSITLTGKKGSAYKSIDLEIDKASYQPLYIKMQTAKRSTVINVNSYLKNQKFPASAFTFNKKEFPAVEIVDLR